MLCDVADRMLLQVHEFLDSIEIQGTTWSLQQGACGEVKSAEALAVWAYWVEALR